MPHSKHSRKTPCNREGRITSEDRTNKSQIVALVTELLRLARTVIDWLNR